MQIVPSEWSDRGLDATWAVFASLTIPEEWEDARSTLIRAFEVTRDAAIVQESVVYVVMTDDLLGRRGPLAAMVATGLLSAARSAALEFVKSDFSINVLAVSESTPIEQIIEWVEQLLTVAGPTGELIHLGPDHVGKALA